MLVDISYLRARAAEIQAAGVVAIDTEATGPSEEWSSGSFIDERRAVLHGVSLAWGDQAVYLRACPEVPALMQWLGGASGVAVWMHNAHFDIRVLRNAGVPTEALSKVRDTMVLAHRLGMGVARPDGGWAYGLKAMAKHHLGHTMTEFDALTAGMAPIPVGWPDEEAYREAVATYAAETEQLLAAGKRLTKKRDQEHAKHLRALVKTRSFRKPTIDDVDPEVVARYAADDARQTLRLAVMLHAACIEAGYWDTFLAVDVPLVQVVRQMQDTGIAVDRAHFETLRQSTLAEAQYLAQEWQELVGCNIQSASQCAKRLFDELKWFEKTEAAKTPSGAYSVGKAVLAQEKQRWAEEAKLGPCKPWVAADIKSRHSKVYKLATAYTDAILGQLPYRDDGRLRCHLKLTGTDTGRFSATGPNLLAMPRDAVRGGFVAPPGRVLVAADFSMLEIVIAAHYSRDEALRQVIEEGRNQHDLTAASLGIPRPVAKVVNLGCQYGMGPRKLAATLNIPLEGGKAPQAVVEMWEGWRETYAGLVAFSERAAKAAKERGYVKTLLGRRRFLPGIHSSDRYERSKAERQAGNSVIQGTAADIANVSMVRLAQRLPTTARLLLQVHDELLVECDEADAERVADDLRWAMTGAASLRYSLKVEVKWGRSWQQCK